MVRLERWLQAGEQAPWGDSERIWRSAETVVIEDPRVPVATLVQRAGFPPTLFLPSGLDAEVREKEFARAVAMVLVSRLGHETVCEQFAQVVCAA